MKGLTSGDERFASLGECVFPGASLEVFSLILSMPGLKNHRMLTSLLLRSRVLCLEFLVRHFLRIRLSGVSLFPHHLISGGDLMPPLPLMKAVNGMTLFSDVC